jgi:hypothetical protein
MRTTLTVDDDVMDAARALADAEGRSLGAVVSELARRGLLPRDTSLDDEEGFPVFRVGAPAPAITGRMVQAALDE